MMKSHVVLLFGSKENLTACGSRMNDAMKHLQPNFYIVKLMSFLLLGRLTHKVWTKINF